MDDVPMQDRVTKLLQCIHPDGTPAADWRPDRALDERLPFLYETMVVTRELDHELVALQRQGQLALYTPCEGQEAAQVGAASALRDTDWLFPAYRELGCYLVRGIDPGGIGLMWRGAWHGGLGFVERMVAPMAISVGTNAPHAVGSAMASSWLDDGVVTVAFIGDGATSEGEVHEALNLAAVRNAPCVFYVQNNGWAISTPPSDQFRADALVRRAAGYGIVGVRVDGNDLAACYTAMSEAADRARGGGGPTFIEAVTYRLGPHTTSDDPSRYRSDDDVTFWRQHDPIARCRAYLERRSESTEALHARAMARAAELRSRLRDAVFDAQDPLTSEVFDHVFSQSTPALLKQKAELEAELSA